MATITTAGLEALLEALGLETPSPAMPTADVLSRPLDIARSYLANILCSLITCDAATAYASIQWPNNIENGDLTIILPKLSPGAKPFALAFDITDKFPKCPLFILPFAENVHLRIMFEPETLRRLLLPYIKDRRESYGCNPSLGLRDHCSTDAGRKKVVVEFSSPNIASHFQGKHLRSTILGANISNLYEAMGWEVVTVNYLGDWGKPIGLLGVGWEKFGSEEEFERDPVAHLLDIYHKIHELFLPEQIASKEARDTGGDPAEIEGKGLFAERNAFSKRMENGDEQALAFSKRVREVNIEKYTELYARLNIDFDEYSGESQVSRDIMTEVEGLLKNKGITEESGGSWIIDMRKHGGKAGTVIIRDRTGSSTYFLRDLAAAIERYRKYDFDKMLYVVAADQHASHFPRLFKILELMDMSDLASKLQHVHFSDNSQTSEKHGQAHTLRDILMQHEEAMQDSLTAAPGKADLLGDLSDAVSALSITSLIFHEMSTRKATDPGFDLKKSTAFESGTGPDLQYRYEQLGILLKDNVSDGSQDYESSIDSITGEDYTDLLRLLIQYPDVTHAAYQSLEPSMIVTYLSNVAAQVAICLEENINGGDAQVQEAEGLEEADRARDSAAASESPQSSGPAEAHNRQPAQDERLPQAVLESREILDDTDVSQDNERGDMGAGNEETKPHAVTAAQASFYAATRTVLENGMKLLGIVPLESPKNIERVDTPLQSNSAVAVSE